MYALRTHRTFTLQSARIESDDEDGTFSGSKDENSGTPPPKNRKLSSSLHKLHPHKPEMKIVSTTQSSSSAGHDDFVSLLMRQRDRQPSLPENRPNGELQTKISSSKKRKIDQANQRKKR
jgi:hypothetical protein